MNKQYILRPTRIHVLPEGEPLYSEHATIVQTVDEAAGEFIEIRQQLDVGAECGITLNNADEWNAIAAAVGDMFVEIKKWGRSENGVTHYRDDEGRILGTRITTPSGEVVTHGEVPENVDELKVIWGHIERKIKGEEDGRQRAADVAEFDAL